MERYACYSAVNCRCQLGSNVALASGAEPGEFLIDVRVRPRRLAPLKHVTAIVSSFLDYSACWSIASACARGAAAPNGVGVSPRLLDRIAAHRAASAVRHPFAAQQQSDAFLPPMGIYTRCSRIRYQRRPAGSQMACGLIPALSSHHCSRRRSEKRTIACARVAIGEKSTTGAHSVLGGERALLRRETRPPARRSMAARTYCSATTHMFFVTLEEAARNGELELVRWLCEVRGEWSPYAAVLAASGGHLQVLEWLRTNLFSSSSSAISMDDTAAGGHLDVLRWLQSHSGYATPGAMNKAAVSGHLEFA
ncbi:hypothetical protein V7S43_017915 [Phytophthora oleae]|uniref:Ankyrin repeat protein n=1 Tax=Phytophthora oleae TaxID=2107226 RepID=A0ABD3ES03_9STRA